MGAGIQGPSPPMIMLFFDGKGEWDRKREKKQSQLSELLARRSVARMKRVSALSAYLHMMVSAVLSAVHSINDEELEKQIPEVSSRTDCSENWGLLEVVWVRSETVDEVVVVEHVPSLPRGSGGEEDQGLRGSGRRGEGRGKTRRTHTIGMVALARPKAPDRKILQ